MYDDLFLDYIRTVYLDLKFKIIFICLTLGLCVAPQFILYLKGCFTTFTPPFKKVFCFAADQLLLTEQHLHNRWVELLCLSWPGTDVIIESQGEKKNPKLFEAWAFGSKGLLVHSLVLFFKTSCLIHPSIHLFCLSNSGSHGAAAFPSYHSGGHPGQLVTITGPL